MSVYFVTCLPGIKMIHQRISFTFGTKILWKRKVVVVFMYFCGHVHDAPLRPRHCFVTLL